MDAIDIKSNDKLTLISINGMAMTSKDEIKVIEVYPDKFIFQRGRKRSLYKMSLPLKNDVMVFKGHKIPVMTDFEYYNGRVMLGNACFNLGGMETPKLREYIDKNNINPNFNHHGCILNIREDIDNPELVYPEVDIYHAVISRIKEKQNG